MIFDLTKDAPDQNFAAEVCIVGAGAAGIVLARELSSRGKRVLLLEAGGLACEDLSQEPKLSEIAGLAHRGIHEGRIRAFGGTTTKWGGQILELAKEDFILRSWIPGSGWPFPKEELRTYYQRAAEMEGLDRVILEDRRVWQELGMEQPAFGGMESYLTRWCPEPNFARLHGERLAQDANARTVVHANVVGFELAGERVDGVRARTSGNQEMIFRAEQYIFCLGAIESSRFFLQPRAGGLPWNQSGLLGCHFQDHIDCNAASVLPKSERDVHRAFDGIFVRGYKYQPKVKLPFERQQGERTLNVAATLAFENEADETLAAIRTTAKDLLRGRIGQVKKTDLSRITANLPSFARQSYRYAIQRRSWQPASAAISLRVHCEQEPNSSSALTLSHDRDAFGMHRARLDWRVSELELHTIRIFVATATQGLSSVADVLPIDGLKDDDSLRAECEDSFHHMGGMRMDDCPSRGVVDTRLRLHGTRNAWVCSSAVFPTSGFSNPTHTLLALALRLADELCHA